MSTVPRETGRERSQRIEMDHYRRRGGLAKSKIAMAVIGAGFGVAAMAYALVDSKAVNTGPLSEPHASLEQDCQVCHQTLTPIASDSVRNFGLLGIDQHESIDHTFQSCTSCHRSSEHPIGDHFRDSMTADFQLLDKNCVLCHSEHHGRAHDIALVSEQQCAHCHGQLDSVLVSGSQSVQLGSDNTSIVSFTTQHGDFQSLANGDPGQVTFDHAQHLLPGQPGQGKDVMRLGDLEPEQREQYRRKMEQLKASDAQFADLDTSDDGLVQLDCSSCHQLAGAPQFGVTMTSDSELGRYFAPISFDRHCAACHSINPAGRSENTLPIPHAAPWSEVDTWLAAKSARQPQERAESSPLGVGIGAGSDDQASPDDERVRSWRAATLEDSRAMVRQQCLKCHQAELIQDDASIMAARRSDGPPLIPQRWLRHGIYDHAAHPGIDCRYCHQQAYAEGTPDQAGSDQNIVMIGGIETCVGCHRPAETATPGELMDGDQPREVLGTQPLWASDRCTMCHRYHTTEMTSRPANRWAGATP